MEFFFETPIINLSIIWNLFGECKAWGAGLVKQKRTKCVQNVYIV